MATSKINLNLNTELLWRNDNPGSPFTPQTINFSKSVKGVIVKYREHSSNVRGWSETILYGVESIQGALKGFRYSNSPHVYFQRPLILNKDSIAFENAYPMTSFGTWGSIDNNYAVPTAIIGIY